MSNTLLDREKVSTQKETNKKKSIYFRVFVIVAVVIFIICAVLTVIIGSIKNTDNIVKFSTTPSRQFEKTLATSLIFNRDEEVTQDELNNYLAYQFENQIYLNDDFSVDGVAFEFLEDSAIMYLKFSYKDNLFILSSDIFITLNSKNNYINIAFSNSKVGTFPVNSSLLLDLVFKDLSFTYKDNILTLPTTYTFNIFSQNIKFNIDNLQIKDSKMIFKVSTQDIIKNILDIII